MAGIGWSPVAAPNFNNDLYRLGMVMRQQSLEGIGKSLTDFGAAQRDQNTNELLASILQTSDPAAMGATRQAIAGQLADYGSGVDAVKVADALGKQQDALTARQANQMNIDKATSDIADNKQLAGVYDAIKSNDPNAIQTALSTMANPAAGLALINTYQQQQEVQRQFNAELPIKQQQANAATASAGSASLNAQTNAASGLIDAAVKVQAANPAKTALSVDANGQYTSTTTPGMTFGQATQAVAGMTDAVRSSYGLAPGTEVKPGTTVKSSSGKPIQWGNGEITFDNFLNAIDAQESGGNYQARSTDGAMGRWQVMPQNLNGKWADWGKEAIGRTISPEEFMANPQLQDQIAKFKLKQYYEEHGPAGAASMWYSGKPVPSDKKAANGPSPVGYVNDINARMGIGGNNTGSNGQPQPVTISAALDTKGNPNPDKAVATTATGQSYQIDPAMLGQVQSGYKTYRNQLAQNIKVKPLFNAVPNDDALDTWLAGKNKGKGPITRTGLFSDDKNIADAVRKHPQAKFLNPSRLTALLNDLTKINEGTQGFMGSNDDKKIEQTINSQLVKQQQQYKTQLERDTKKYIGKLANQLIANSREKFGISLPLDVALAAVAPDIYAKSKDKVANPFGDFDMAAAPPEAQEQPALPANITSALANFKPQQRAGLATF